MQIRDLCLWLQQFPQDAEIEIPFFELEELEDFDPAVGYAGDRFLWSPTTPEWTYNPTEEAMSRGAVKKTFPRDPGHLEIGFDI